MRVNNTTAKIAIKKLGHNFDMTVIPFRQNAIS